MAMRENVGALAGALFLLCAPAGGALADDGLDRAVANVPANIHTVRSGGFWEHGGQEGTFRVIATASGAEHVQYRLFVQWLKTDSTSNGQAVVRTVRIKELQPPPETGLSVAIKFGDVNAFEVTATSEGPRVKTTRQRFLFSGNGRYRVLKK